MREVAMTDIQSALAPVKAYIFVSRSANSGAYFLAEVGVANDMRTGGGLVILVLTCSKWRPPLLKRAGATTM